MFDDYTFCKIFKKWYIFVFLPSHGYYIWLSYYKKVMYLLCTRWYQKVLNCTQKGLSYINEFFNYIMVQNLSHKLVSLSLLVVKLVTWCHLPIPTMKWMSLYWNHQSLVVLYQSNAKFMEIDPWMTANGVIINGRPENVDFHWNIKSAFFNKEDPYNNGLQTDS